MGNNPINGVDLDGGDCIGCPQTSDYQAYHESSHVFSYDIASKTVLTADYDLLSQNSNVEFIPSIDVEVHIINAIDLLPDSENFNRQRAGEATALALDGIITAHGGQMLNKAESLKNLGIRGSREMLENSARASTGLGGALGMVGLGFSAFTYANDKSDANLFNLALDTGVFTTVLIGSWAFPPAGAALGTAGVIYGIGTFGLAMYGTSIGHLKYKE